MELILKGVKQNNLKDINLTIPLNQSVVITGPSGSGKSSLAFETIYAEGQRRYIQSLSTYARQFLERFSAPDAERIDNVPPTISVEQVNPVKNSRATVGTSAEIYDYLRVLYSKIGVEYCPKCETALERNTPDKVVEKITSLKSDYLLLGYPYTIPKKKSEADWALQELIGMGHVRLVFDEEVHKISDLIGEARPRGRGCTVLLSRIDLPVEPATLSSRIHEALNIAWDKEERKFIVLTPGNMIPSTQNTFEPGLRCVSCSHQVEPKTAASFSFNHPLGACENCKGFGNTLELDKKLVIKNPKLSLSDGAIEPFTKPSMKKWQTQLMEFCFETDIDVDTPFEKLSQKVKKDVFEGNRKFLGVKGIFEKISKKKYQLKVKVFVNRYLSSVQCTVCEGARLKPSSLQVKVNNKNIHETASLSVNALKEYFEMISLSKTDLLISEDIRDSLIKRLSYLNNVGLGYLEMTRLTKTLSGGEFQRLVLASQLSHGLTDTLYVLDEPSIGLHPEDTERLMEVITNLLNQGNSLVVVEHDPELIEWAQYVVDLGPGAGRLGGELLFSGTQEAFSKSDSLTSKAIKKWRAEAGVKLKEPKKKIEHQVTLRGVHENNLKNVTVQFPLEQLVVVTGVSGSGKSSLVTEGLYQSLRNKLSGEILYEPKVKEVLGSHHLSRIEMIDQSPIGKSTRSNPVTFIKAFDDIRTLLSRTEMALRLGLSPGHFSFNVKGGRCDHCEGEGRVKVDMVFMEDVYVPCEVCEGRRYKDKVLKVHYKGKNIFEILNMTIEEVIPFFDRISQIKTKLSVLEEVGLGYLTLGQSSDTLSGGEAQRLKIARELQNSSGGQTVDKTLFILDEPTTGLHFKEIDTLISVFRALIAKGHTVVVIEHNSQMMCEADYMIDIGPHGGERGGEVVATGTPLQVSQVENSMTGKHLKTFL